MEYIKMFREDLKLINSLIGKIAYVFAVISGILTIVLYGLTLISQSALVALITTCCLVFFIAMSLVCIAIKTWESRKAERTGKTVMKKKKVLSSIVMIFALLFAALGIFAAFGIGSNSVAIEWGSFAVAMILFTLREHMQEDGEPRQYYFSCILFIIGFVLALLRVITR